MTSRPEDGTHRVARVRVSRQLALCAWGLSVMSLMALISLALVSMIPS